MHKQNCHHTPTVLCLLHTPSDLPLAVAGVKSNEVEVTGESALPLTEGTATRLGWFLLGILRVAGETEQALIVMAGGHPQPHLPQLLGRLLLLLSSLVSGKWSCDWLAFTYHMVLV